MKTKTLNYLFLTAIIIYVLFLVSRLLFERLPQNPLFLLGFFLIYSFFAKGIPAFILFIKENKEKFLKVKKDSSKGFFLKYFLIFCDITDKIEKFVHITFLRNFLGKHMKISEFFFSCALFYEKLVKINKFRMIYVSLIIIIPWLVSNILLVIEIFTTKNIYYTLYALSLNFLIFRIFSFWVVIVKNTLQLMANIPCITYFHCFFLDDDGLKFFVNNSLIRSVLLFDRPALAKKTILKSSWIIFQEILYFSKLAKALEILILEFRHLKQTLLSLKILLFLVIFSLFYFEEFFFEEIYLSLFILAATFVGFLIFIDYLKTYLEWNSKFITFEELLETFGCFTVYMDDFKLPFTNELVLHRHSFLTDEDLPLYINGKSVKTWAEERSCLFTKGYNPNHLLEDEDKLIWDETVHEVYLWYLSQVEADLINFRELTYNFDKAIELYGEDYCKSFLFFDLCNKLKKMNKK